MGKLLQVLFSILLASIFTAAALGFFVFGATCVAISGEILGWWVIPIQHSPVQITNRLFEAYSAFIIGIVSLVFGYLSSKIVYTVTDPLVL